MKVRPENSATLRPDTVLRIRGRAPTRVKEVKYFETVYYTDIVYTGNPHHISPSPYYNEGMYTNYNILP